MNFYASKNGSYPALTDDVSYCIGLDSGQACWNNPGGSPTSNAGDTALNSGLKEFMSTAPKDPSRIGVAGDRDLYRRGTTASPTSGIALGCVANYQKGNYILWQPEAFTTYTDADCQGVGVIACCGNGGPCGGPGSNGWYCAVGLQ